MSLKPEFLPSNMVREIASNRHEELLNDVANTVVRSLRLDMLSTTVRALKLYDEYGNIDAVMARMTPLQWIEEDGGSNCFGLAYYTQQRLKRDYGINSYIIPFAPDMHPAASVKAYLVAGHGAVFVPSIDESGELNEHLLETGFGIAKPLLVDGKESQAAVDNRIFWVEGRKQQALLIAQGTKIHVSPYSLDIWGPQEIQDVINRLIRARLKVGIASQDVFGETASIKILVEKNIIKSRIRGQDTVTVPIADVAQGCIPKAFYSAAQGMQLEPGDVIQKIVYVAQHLTDYRRGILLPELS